MGGGVWRSASVRKRCASARVCRLARPLLALRLIRRLTPRPRIFPNSIVSAVCPPITSSRPPRRAPQNPGTGADRVLIASGALDEETYLRALADELGVPFEPLDGVARALCPLGDERLTARLPGIR